jgi:hypothetical protein
VSKNHNINEHAQKRDSASQAKKSYQPPSVLSRERLESAANVCTGFGLKSDPGAPAPGGGTCGQAGLNS